MELFWRFLPDFDLIGRGTLPFAPWAILSVGVVAVGLLCLYFMRSRAAEPTVLDFDEDDARFETTGDNAAIAALGQALVQNPHALEALKRRGLCYSQAGDYDLAMQDFHMWVLRAPDCGDAYFHRGNIWQKLELSGLAFSDYRSALRLDPSHEGARGALADLMRDTTTERPKAIFSLAALFAARASADNSQPSRPAKESARDRTGGVSAAQV
jgi:tetratricopeptide (TPR) repeat protein